MRVLGLTGGIASGKSLVASLLREMGATVVDADRLARQAVAPGSACLQAIVLAFGEGTLGPDGGLDRVRMGGRVFGDEDARRQLNAIVHPEVGRLAAERFAAAAGEGQAMAFFEAALLVEEELDRGLDGLVGVSLAPDEQRRRLMARDGLTEQQARARILAQASLADKLARADHVVDNGGSIEETRRQVGALWERLCHAERASQEED